eukprot:3111232-Amphidinium_carterae.3
MKASICWPATLPIKARGSYMLLLHLDTTASGTEQFTIQSKRTQALGITGPYAKISCNLPLALPYASTTASTTHPDASLRKSQTYPFLFYHTTTLNYEGFYGKLTLDALQIKFQLQLHLTFDFLSKKVNGNRTGSHVKIATLPR